jgi:hypothetical protein
MTRFRILRLSALGLVVGGSVALARPQEATQPFRYETQRVDDYLAQRAAALAAALDFAGWPKTSELYAAPAVSRALLAEPAEATGDVRACTTVGFGDELWPQCTWSWKTLSEGRKPSPEDWLDLQVTVAPSGRAAQEHLLGSLADNQLPTEAMVARYRSAKRPENLGNIAFIVQAPKGFETTVTFLRNNVAFRIRGHGALAADVLPLASRLDERVIAQAPLTLEELRSRSLPKAARK